MAIIKTVEGKTPQCAGLRLHPSNRYDALHSGG